MVAGRAAQAVRAALAVEHQLRGGQRRVDRAAGRLVGALGERRGGLEAPVADAAVDRSAARRARPSCRAARAGRTRRAPPRGRPGCMRLVQRPTLRQEPHQPGVVHGLDGRGAPLGGRDELERGVGLAASRGSPRRGRCARTGCACVDVSNSTCGSWQQMGRRVDDLHVATSHASTSSSSSARYSSRHLARCSLPDEVFGSVPGLHQHHVAWRQAAHVERAVVDRVAHGCRASSVRTSATTTTLSLPL